MLNLIRITEASNLAIHSLAYLIKSDDERLHSVSEMAARINVSEAHLAKIFQRLVKLDFVESSRGAKGGFSLKINPRKVSIYDILEALDGPFKENSCLLGKSICEKGKCLLKGTALSLKKNLKEIKLIDFK